MNLKEKKYSFIIKFRYLLIGFSTFKMQVEKRTMNYLYLIKLEQNLYSKNEHSSVQGNILF
jgi:hypothetical protein